MPNATPAVDAARRRRLIAFVHLMRLDQIDVPGTEQDDPTTVFVQPGYVQPGYFTSDTV